MRPALIGAAAVAVAIATGPAASARSTGSNDAFTGTVASTSRHSVPDRGRLAIDLAAPSSGQAARTLTLTFRGRGCAGKRHCVELTGRLTGTLTRVLNGPSDTGSSFTIRAAGRLAPLGHVSASGMVRGTGFIARGRMTMYLTLRTQTGKAAVNAQSGLVPGSTSPELRTVAGSESQGQGQEFGFSVPRSWKIAIRCCEAKRS